MRIIILANYRGKLKALTVVIFSWLLLFMLGSYIIENVLLYNIAIDPLVEFSYPHNIVIDDVFASSIIKSSKVITSFCPTKPRTGQFSNYESLEGNFSFEYPSAFEIKEETFEGSDVLYHIGFQDRGNVGHGFVQIWRFTYDLGGFLDNSKNSSQSIYKYFKTKKVTLDDTKGYLWDYSVNTDKGYYKGMEVFLKKDDRMYRLSYFMPESRWDSSQSRLFWKMAKSLRIK